MVALEGESGDGGRRQDLERLGKMSPQCLVVDLEGGLMEKNGESTPKFLVQEGLDESLNIICQD